MKTNLRYQNGFLYEHHGAWGLSDTASESQNRMAPPALTARPNIWSAPKTFAVFLMSNGAGHHSCKRSIAIGSVQIRE